MDFLPDLLTVVEWATVVVTFIMMASGMPVCVSMYKKRSVANVPYLLFLISTFVSSLGLQYGILIGNSTLTLINVVSVCVWGAYVSTYILVSKSKVTPLLKLLAVAGLYSAHLYYLTILPSNDVVLTVGKYLLFWCTILCVIPANEIVTMVQEKSTKCCNLPLLFGGTLSGVVWYLYGYLMDDATIYFPNIPALLVSSVKFFLMFIYGLPSKQTAKNSSSAVTRDSQNNVHKVTATGITRRNK
uniref:Sugar transporter SWEET n=1 Tax=Arion vulgaris TaxID=1028688 RepID=A0A0B7A730_9EUPU